MKLGFEHGVELRDPQGLLVGNGKQVRYVLLRPDAPVPVAALREFLRRAIGRVSA